MRRGELLCAEPAPFERARPVTLHEHVGAGRDAHQLGRVGGIVEVAERRALAVPGVDHERGHVRECGRVHEQDARAVLGERASDRRSREHPRHVEDPHAAERSLGVAHRVGGAVSQFRDVDQPERCERLGVRMRVPLLRRAGDRTTDACFGERVLEVGGVPPHDRGRGIVGVADAQDRPRRGVEVGKAAVQVDPPPVTRFEQRGERTFAAHVEVRRGIDALQQERDQ